MLLAACGGGGGGAITSTPDPTPGSDPTPAPDPSPVNLSGVVSKGPLENALVFIDYDGDQVLDATEPSTMTDAQGRYQINNITNQAAEIIVHTTSTTIDHSFGGSVPTLVMRAPQDSSVVSLATTVSQSNNELSINEVATRLGLDDIDLLNFNPYAEGVDADQALRVEQTYQQLLSIVSAFTTATENNGVSEEQSMSSAINSIASVISSTTQGSVDLTSTETYGQIRQEVIITLSGAGDTEAISQAIGDRFEAIQTVAQAIENITSTDLNEATTKEIFSTNQLLDAGETDVTALTNALQNAAPTDITLARDSFAENASSLVVSQLTVVDADQAADTIFTFSLSGADAASFTINENNELAFSTAPNFEVKSSYDLTIKVTDAGGKQYAESFTITISDSDDMPVVENGISDQTVRLRDNVNISIPADAFSDEDGNALTYSVSGLPASLSLDGNIISGTLAEADIGTHEIMVTAADGNGGQATTRFTLTIREGNIAPTLANAITDQSATEDSAFSFTIPANRFSDMDAGDSLTYSTSNLPGWLNFDAATRVFSGTPTNLDIGTVTVTVTVTATDGSSATATDSFDIVVNNTNDAPTLANAITDQSATEDSAFSFTIPANTFSDMDAGDSLTYSTSNLPGWLSFDAATRVFSGTPTNLDIGTVTVTVTATDGSSATATDSFDIVVEEINVAPANLALNSATIAENSAGANIGTFSATDSNSGDSLTYSLASGDDNELFEISDTTLKLKSGTQLNYEADNLYTISVTVSDGELSQTKSFDISVTNVEEGSSINPTVGTNGFAKLFGKVSDATAAGVTTANKTYYITTEEQTEQLLAGRAWGESDGNNFANLGNGFDLTYSFMNTSTSAFLSNLNSTSTTARNNQVDWADSSKTYIRDVFSDFANVSLLSFSEVNETASTAGQIRLGVTATDSTSFAYYPGGAIGGSIWYSDNTSLSSINGFNDPDWVRDGTYFSTTIMHEIGHAMGLAHPFEESRNISISDGGVSFVSNFGIDQSAGTANNSLAYTVMSYAEYVGENIDSLSGLYNMPTTLMIDDIAALQAIYGVNEQYNRDDTTYSLSSFSNQNFIYASIWDAGGEDTFTWADQTTDAQINLGSGAFSFFGIIDSLSDTDLNGKGSGSTAWDSGSGLLGISYDAIIENAIGGSNADMITGNAQSNKLYGGDDTLRDQLTGNDGNDFFFIKSSNGAAAQATADLVADFVNGQDMIALDDLTFAELTIANNAGDTIISQTSNGNYLLVLDSVDHTSIDENDFITTITDFI